MHYGYELLENIFPVFTDHHQVNDSDSDSSSGPYSTWFMVICQVLVDALLMDSIMVATAIMTSSVLEGKHQQQSKQQTNVSFTITSRKIRSILQGIWKDLSVSYIPACQASYISSVFWSPVQLLSFKYVPLPFRVAAINLQDIAWFATISYMSHRCRNNNHKEKSE